MIAAWMMYVMGVGVVLAGAAAALESGLRGRGRQGRWVWLGALLATGAMGVAAAAGIGTGAPASGGGAPGAVVALPPLVVAADSGLHLLDRPLVASWVLLSGLLALLWLADVARTWIRRRSWPTEAVRGVPALRSRHVGPAVVGVIRPRIVVPSWFETLDRSAQDLALAHESEHARARDPGVLSLGYLALLALPWNPAGWYAFRRLRLAVELDCDQRVLQGRSGQERRYGGLLLDVAERTVTPQPLSVGLFWSPSMMEKRVVALLARARSMSPLRVASLGAVAVGLASVAWFVPGPTAGPEADVEARADVDRPPGEPRRTVPDEPVPDLPPPPPASFEELARKPAFTPFTEAPDIANRQAVVEALRREYPPLLRDAGIVGTVQIWFFIDKDGGVLNTRLNESSGHPALDQAALNVADVFRFTPGQLRGDPVPVWVSLPITFSL